MMGKPVTASVECLDLKGLQPEEKIELAARICYNSEKKIEGGVENAVAFLKGQVICHGHESVIEHDGAVFIAPDVNAEAMTWLLCSWQNAPLMQFSFQESGRHQCYDTIISGNFRAFRDLYKQMRAEEELFGPCQLIIDMMKLLAAQVPLTNYRLDIPTDFPEGYRPQAQWRGTQSHLALFNSFNQPNSAFHTEDPLQNVPVLLKHATLTFRIDGVSRALTHQLVRHRPVAFSQRSQRYCGEKDFDFIIPPDALGIKARDKFDQESSGLMIHDMMDTAAGHYSRLQKEGLKNEDARFVLPNACETNIVVTATLNQWKHMIKLRADGHAQWEIRGVFKEIHKQICEICPGLGFDLIQF